MTDFPQDHPQIVRRSALEDWLIAAATALVALVLLGILPRLFW